MEKATRAAEHKKESSKLRMLKLKENLLKGNADGARELQEKSVMLKKVASKLRFRELEDFKKDQEEQVASQKYRIIEKHVNMDKMAQCKCFKSNNELITCL